MDNLAGYWKSLTKFRRAFLVMGILTTLPILLVLIIVAGVAEAWKLVQSVRV